MTCIALLSNPCTIFLSAWTTRFHHVQHIHSVYTILDEFSCQWKQAEFGHTKLQMILQEWSLFSFVIKGQRKAHYSMHTMLWSCDCLWILPWCCHRELELLWSILQSNLCVQHQCWETIGLMSLPCQMCSGRSSPNPYAIVMFFVSPTCTLTKQDILS